MHAGGVTRLASGAANGAQSDGNSSLAVMSARGRFIAFVSEATNLVPRDTNGHSDVFVRDRRLHTTRRVSVGPGGLQANGNSFFPETSANGNVVAFFSDAANLVPGDTNGTGDVFVHVLGP